MPTTPASIFADEEDRRKYDEAIAQGKTEEEALSVGDNQKGAWGGYTGPGSGPQVALPPGLPGVYKGRQVRLVGPKGTTIATIGDKAPDNGRIDLNPDAAAAIGHPGGVVPIQWSFMDGSAPPQQKIDLRDTAPVRLNSPIPDLTAPVVDLLAPSQTASAIPEIPAGALQADENSPSAGVVSTDSYGQPVIAAAPTEVVAADPNTPNEPAGTPKTVDTQPPPPGTITGTNPDGSIQHSTGVRAYPDGHIEWPDGAGGTFKRWHGSKTLLYPAADPKKTMFTKPTNSSVYDMSDPAHPKKIDFPTEPAGGGGTAEDPFKGLSDGEKAQVQAIVDGRSPLTSRMLSSNSPDIQRKMERVYLIDPGFEVATYDQRKQTVLDYAPKGKNGQAIQSLNQTINHLGHLEDVTNDVGGGYVKVANEGVQWLERNFTGGKAAQALGAYGTTMTAVKEEMAKLLKNGVATESEAKDWEEQLDPALPPDVRKGNYKTIISLLAGRLQTQADQYKSIVHKPFDGLVLPQSKKILDRHGWDLGQNDATGAGAAPTPTPDPNEPKMMGIPVSKARAAYDQANNIVEMPDDGTPEMKAAKEKAQNYIDRITRAGGIPQ